MIIMPYKVLIIEYTLQFIVSMSNFQKNQILIILLPAAKPQCQTYTYVGAHLTFIATPIKLKWRVGAYSQ